MKLSLKKNDIAYTKNLVTISFGILFFLVILIGCTNKNSQVSNPFCNLEVRKCFNEKLFVKIVTNRGEMIFELDGKSSPVTVGNFLELINKGVYNKTVFHRVIKIPSPFIVQGGDPLSKDPNTPALKYGMGGYINPKNGQVRLIPLEIKLKTESIPRYNQLITNPKEYSQLQLVHQRGSIAMARAENPDSGSAQFYIALKSLPELDGRYSIFGKIIKGIDILDKIREGDLILKTKIIQNN